jgi:hypothetical protein
LADSPFYSLVCECVIYSVWSVSERASARTHTHTTAPASRQPASQPASRPTYSICTSIQIAIIKGSRINSRREETTTDVYHCARRFSISRTRWLYMWMPLRCFNGNPRLILLSRRAAGALIWLFSRFCAFEWTAASATTAPAIGPQIYAKSVCQILNFLPMVLRE